MESLVHRVQHGNNKRADEAKLYHEIRNVNDTIIEIHTEPQEPDDDPWEMYYPWRRNIDKGYKQRQLKIVLSQVEKARSIRKGQLIHKLDLLRKNIKSMERELEKISSLRKKAYKCAYKHGAQQNEAKSSYTEYQSLMTHVKELARRGDTDELIKNQMEEPKEMSNNKKAQQLDVYNIASPRQHVKKDIAEKLYQVLSFSESSIIQDIDKCKKDEIRIINDIMWFSSCDKRREWKQQHIKNVEKDLRKTVNHELPMTSIDGFFWLTTERDWYVHGIQHGNNKRSEEAKFYHEIRNLNDRIEIYTEPTAVNKTWRRNSQWRPALPKGYKQQQLKVIASVLQRYKISL
ncbi:hypothetical protein Tco_1576346 [Tanacetum coccineum]